jgi:hypothetical protein
VTLTDVLAATLRKRGSVQTTVATDEEADEWRTAARAAARQLGRPVETIQHRHVVVASLKGWPANELERQISDAEIRKVMNRMSPLTRADEAKS